MSVQTGLILAATILLSRPRVLRPTRGVVGDGLVGDDHIQLGDDGDVLTVCAPGGVGTLEGTGNHRSIPNPPHVPVPELSTSQGRGIHLLTRRDHGDDPFGPVAGDHLLSVPVSLAEHQLAEARHVPRRERHVVGQVHRPGRVARFAVLRTIPVLESQGLDQIRGEGVVDVLARQSLEYGSGRIEVPVAVEHVGAGLLGAARRSVGQVVAEIRSGVIHAGTRGDEVLHLGPSLDGKQTADIVHSHLLQSEVQVDGALGHVVSVEHGQDALAHRGHVTQYLDISVFEEHAPAHDDDNAVGVQRLRVRVDFVQEVSREADLRGILDSLPRHTGGGFPCRALRSERRGGHEQQQGRQDTLSHRIQLVVVVRGRTVRRDPNRSGARTQPNRQP